VFYVGSGTYDWSSEVMVSSKNITIIGAGASNTVLDRHQGGRFFTIREMGSVTLIGVTVQNGANLGGHGGVVHMTDGTFTASGCTFTENAAGLGNVVHMTGGTITASGCTFSENR
jgi:hypothetical protein